MILRSSKLFGWGDTTPISAIDGNRIHTAASVSAIGQVKFVSLRHLIGDMFSVKTVEKDTITGTAQRRQISL